jgi:hypothetical protein
MHRLFRRLLWRLKLVKLEQQRCWRDVSEITIRLAPTLAANDSRKPRQLSG